MVRRHTRILYWLVSALVAMCASASLMLRAGHFLPYGWGAFCVGLLVGTAVLLAPAWFVVSRLLPALLRDTPRRQWWGLLGAAGLGAAGLLGLVGLRTAPPTWHFADRDGEHELVGSTLSSEWGATIDAISLHAHVADRPDFRWRAELPLPRALRRIGGHVDLRITQPRAAVFDEHGQPWLDSDGAELHFFVAQQNAGRALAAMTIDPIHEAGDRQWRRVRLALPPACDAILVGINPRATTWHDTVLIHADRLVLPGGIRLAFLDWVSLSLALAVLLAFGAQSTAPADTGTPTSAEAAPARARIWRHVVGSWIAFILIGTLLVTIFHARERTAIFFWDFSGYWIAALGLVDQLRAAPGHALLSVCWSIADQDYNLLAALPIAPVMWALGGERLVYLLAVVVLYAGLSLVGLMFAARRCAGPLPSPVDRWAVWVPVVVILAAVHFWTPILRGYLDVGGVAIALCVLGLYLRQRRASVSLPCLTAIGMLVALLPLFRRWYAYWAAAFLLLVLVEGVIDLVRRRPWSAAGVRQALRPLVVIGGSAGLVLCAAAAPWVRRAMTSNYRDLFAAYRPYHSVGEALRLVLDDWGLVYMGLIAAAGLVLIAQRGTRRLAVWLAVHTVLVALMFQMTQHYSSQHYYLLLPAVLLVTTLAVVRVLTWLPHVGLRVACLAGCLGIGAFMQVCTYWPEASALATRCGRLIPAARIYPLQRGDTAELGRLLELLDRELAHDSGSVYILSSSGVLTEDILRNAVLQPPGLHFASVQRVAATSHVDERDGFPANLLTSEVVVVASPIQYHLGPEHQRVIGIPAESFLSGRDIAQAFECLPESFQLDGGVTAQVYRKVRPIMPEEIRALSECLRAAYPERPAVYQPPGAT